MKISKLGVMTGLINMMRFTGFMIIGAFIMVVGFDIPLTLESIFVKNILYHMFMVFEFVWGYKKGKAIELAIGESNDKERTSIDSGK